jgi:hypothetical protein
VKSELFEYELSVSFIEIYNENAYDLLNRNHSEMGNENGIKIVFMEGE